MLALRGKKKKGGESKKRNSYFCMALIPCPSTEEKFVIAICQVI